MKVRQPKQRDADEAAARRGGSDGELAWNELAGARGGHVGNVAATAEVLHVLPPDRELAVLHDEAMIVLAIQTMLNREHLSLGGICPTMFLRFVESSRLTIVWMANTATALVMEDGYLSVSMSSGSVVAATEGRGRGGCKCRR